MSKEFDNLFWHDGNLIGINFVIDSKGKSSLEIGALFYKDEDAQNRNAYIIRCNGVSRFNTTLDSAELKLNAAAGNISSGYLKENTLWIYLTMD